MFGCSYYVLFCPGVNIEITAQRKLISGLNPMPKFHVLSDRSAVRWRFAMACSAVFTKQACSGDLERGERLFKTCANCHVVESERSTSGLSLKGVIGRKAGSLRVTTIPRRCGRRERQAWSGQPTTCRNSFRSRAGRCLAPQRGHRALANSIARAFF